MAKELTPKTANTFNQICKLKRDNVSTRNSWMSLAGDGNAKHISIYNQKSGEKATGSVTLTKKEFERFIKFYETGK
jgi:hypothetical protein